MAAFWALTSLSIYVEAADLSLRLPGNIGYNGDRVRFTGRFYKEKGFPANYKSVENPDKARVFRYTQYKVIKRNLRQIDRCCANCLKIDREQRDRHRRDVGQYKSSSSSTARKKRGMAIYSSEYKPYIR